jgi:hypothetical protein
MGWWMTFSVHFRTGVKTAISVRFAFIPNSALGNYLEAPRATLSWRRQLFLASKQTAMAGACGMQSRSKGDGLPGCKNRL